MVGPHFFTGKTLIEPSLRLSVDWLRCTGTISTRHLHSNIINVLHSVWVCVDKVFATDGAILTDQVPQSTIFILSTVVLKPQISSLNVLRSLEKKKRKLQNVDSSFWA